MSFFKKPVVVPCTKGKPKGKPKGRSKGRFKGEWVGKDNGWNARILRKGPTMKETEQWRELTEKELRQERRRQREVTKQYLKDKAVLEPKIRERFPAANSETSRRDKPRKINPTVQNIKTNKIGIRLGRVKTIETEGGQVVKWLVETLTGDNEWWDSKNIKIILPHMFRNLGDIPVSRGDV